MDVGMMGTPESRSGFQQRMHALREQFRLGRMRISAQASRGVGQLTKVRFLPNGRIDLLTIDESARLMANMMFDMLLKDDFPPNLADPPGDTDR
jgi:hypothetical protein